MSEEIVEIDLDKVVPDSEEIALEVVPDVVEAPVDKSKVVLGVPLIRTTSILSFRLRAIDLILGQSVRFSIHLECESGGKIYGDYKEIVIDGDEYLAWGTDDMYVVELIKSKLADIV
jgi:hypothetical protein